MQYAFDFGFFFFASDGSNHQIDWAIKFVDEDMILSDLEKVILPVKKSLSCLAKNMSNPTPAKTS